MRRKHMRRKDREVTNPEKIEQIIKKCHCCRLGFNDNGQVYIVPMNFGCEQQEDSYVLYFHSAKEGRKIDLLLKNPNVCFELDTNYQLNEGSIACEYSARFQSIIGYGTAEIIEDAAEKKKGLCSIMKHNTGKDEWTFDDNMLNAVCVFKVVVSELSCKEHL